MPMTITRRQKTVFASSDGKEHTTEIEALRYETRLTLEALGLKPETAIRFTGMRVNTLRAIAETLTEYADALTVLGDRKAEDETGTWPADANVAPRPGERPGKPHRPASLDRDPLEDDGYGD